MKVSNARTRARLRWLDLWGMPLVLLAIVALVVLIFGIAVYVPLSVALVIRVVSRSVIREALRRGEAGGSG